MGISAFPLDYTDSPLSKWIYEYLSSQTIKNAVCYLEEGKLLSSPLAFQ
jgi:hypothetical protein